jgi:hypothetical protein
MPRNAAIEQWIGRELGPISQLVVRIILLHDVVVVLEI